MYKINKTAVGFLRRYATLLENQTCFAPAKRKPAMPAGMTGLKITAVLSGAYDQAHGTVNAGVVAKAGGLDGDLLAGLEGVLLVVAHQRVQQHVPGAT